MMSCKLLWALMVAGAASAEAQESCNLDDTVNIEDTVSMLQTDLSFNKQIKMHTHEVQSAIANRHPVAMGGTETVPVGHITTVIGMSGVAGADPDGKLATKTRMNGSSGVKLHPVTRDLYYSDQGNGMVRVVSSITGRVRTLAGALGGCSSYGADDAKPECQDLGDGGPASGAIFNYLMGVEFDLDGNGIYISDADHHAIRYVDMNTGTINTIIGNIPHMGYAGDGEHMSKSMINFPHCVVKDHDTNDLYIAEGHNSLVRKVDGKTGIISTLWRLNGTEPMDIILVPGKKGRPDVILAEMGLNSVYRIDSVTGEYSVVAGKVQESDERGPDGLLATQVGLNQPIGLAWDPTNDDLYIGEYMGHTIRKVDGTTGILTTIAGKGNTQGNTGDGGPAKDALLGGPAELNFDPKSRRMYIQDSFNHAVRMIQL